MDAGEDTVQDLKVSEDRKEACHELRPRREDSNIDGWLVVAYV